LGLIKKIFKWFAIALILLLVLTGLDMLVNRNLYHPLIYGYQVGSWFGCTSSRVSDCPNPPFFERALVSKKGMVVTSHREATKVGVEILKAGGTAIDAAVAVGYASAVVDPCCGNLGGGGFMVIHRPGDEPLFINFRERAPNASFPGMFLDQEGQVIKDLSTTGYLAVAVPGTVKGLDLVLTKYGTLSRQKVMAGAIRLAERGFTLNESDVRILRQGEERFRVNPNTSKIFMPQGKLLQPGQRLVQTNLATTLKLIAQKGESAFYGGEIARSVIQASRGSGGILTQQDFEQYDIIESKPLKCDYRGYTLMTAPLPGGGVTLCQMLKILEGYPIQAWGHESPDTWHRMLSAMLFAYSDRNRFLGDPRFVDNPEKRLLSDEYADQVRSKISPNRALDPEALPKGNPTSEGKNTTHYSVIDAKGNAVSVTYTINSLFGAGVIAGETGFLLNNEMDDFSTKPGVPNQFGLVQGDANSIAPGKQPLSSMSPSILLNKGRVALVTGSPGGSTIPTTVLQVISNIVDHHKSVNTAVNLPRLHYQGNPNIVLSEPFALSEQLFLSLWQKGYKIVPFSPWGAAESIGVIDNKHIAGHDKRKPAGSARGLN
jgi:gamma-glutamyltranspeptidase / glutathione hydrolase